MEGKEIDWVVKFLGVALMLVRGNFSSVFVTFYILLGFRCCARGGRIFFWSGFFGVALLGRFWL